MQLASIVTFNLHGSLKMEKHNQQKWKEKKSAKLASVPSHQVSSVI